MYALTIEQSCCERPWVARITGECPKYKFARKFVPLLRDYNSAFVGRRVPTCTFLLEQGEVYEVSVPLNQFQRDRYYCRVNRRNEVERIDQAEVLAAIRVARAIEDAVRPKKWSDKIYGDR